jgi:hypothetical protein
MADGTSDDRACRELAKRPGYDRASILRRSRGRRCRQGRPKRQRSDNYQKNLLNTGSYYILLDAASHPAMNAFRAKRRFAAA